MTVDEYEKILIKKDRLLHSQNNLFSPSLTQKEYRNFDIIPKKPLLTDKDIRGFLNCRNDINKLRKFFAGLRRKQSKISMIAEKFNLFIKKL